MRNFKYRLSGSFGVLKDKIKHPLMRSIGVRGSGNFLGLYTYASKRQEKKWGLK